MLNQMFQTQINLDVSAPPRGKVFSQPYLRYVDWEMRAHDRGGARLLWLIPSSLAFFIVIPFITIYATQPVEAALGVYSSIRPPLSYVGLLLMAYGGYYVAESIRVLLAEGKGIPLGDFVPQEQSKALVEDGVYSETRNPMLFGYFVALVGLGVLRGSPFAASSFPLLFLGIWTLWIKLREEPALEERFGETYRAYRERTPFLLPRRSRR